MQCRGSPRCGMRRSPPFAMAMERLSGASMRGWWSGRPSGRWMTACRRPRSRPISRSERRLRLKPEAVEQEIALDLRSEAGLAKSILLHRLDLMNVPWGRLIDGDAGRGTFREVWQLAWVPELSVRLAEALVHGVTIEQSAAGSARAQAAATTDIGK